MGLQPSPSLLTCCWSGWRCKSCSCAEADGKWQRVSGGRARRLTPFSSAAQSGGWRFSLLHLLPADTGLWTERILTHLCGGWGWGAGGVAGLSICFEQGASAPLLGGICLDFSIDDTQVHNPCSVSIVVLVEYIWVFSPSQLVKTFCLLCYRYTLYLSLSLTFSLCPVSVSLSVCVNMCVCV